MDRGLSLLVPSVGQAAREALAAPEALAAGEAALLPQVRRAEAGVQPQEREPERRELWSLRG
jgi:hypothetical protein